MSDLFTAWLPRRSVTCLDLHGYNGCRYRLLRPRQDKSYSVEISRPGTKGNAILSAFTSDRNAAEGFTRFLVESGARPEQLPHAAAAYFCVKSGGESGIS